MEFISWKVLNESTKSLLFHIDDNNNKSFLFVFPIQPGETNAYSIPAEWSLGWQYNNS